MSCFHDGGSAAYVTRVTDVTAVAATLTLLDSSSNASVVATASPGVNGNNLYVAVTRANLPTFTAGVTSSSKNMTAISSEANIGVGTPVSGTNVGTNYIATLTHVYNGNVVRERSGTSTATITPQSFTVTVQDVNGNVFSTHGPVPDDRPAVRGHFVDVGHVLAVRDERVHDQRARRIIGGCSDGWREHDGPRGRRTRCRRSRTSRAFSAQER